MSLASSAMASSRAVFSRLRAFLWAIAAIVSALALAEDLRAGVSAPSFSSMLPLTSADIEDTNEMCVRPAKSVRTTASPGSAAGLQSVEAS